jgi:hypothetical protein
MLFKTISISFNANVSAISKEVVKLMFLYKKRRMNKNTTKTSKEIKKYI